MVDNRGVSPIGASYFKADNASANKMSEEKQGQGGEYFAQEMQEEETQHNEQTFQDRSAQLRASLNGLAMANAGSIMLMKTLKEREQNKLNKAKLKKEENNNKEQEDEEVVYED
ncbi:MAG: hypothetical protein IJW73_08135 [Candidatus Gastranaerophilales bacterium]|nr:hypothetical protein [Candidatus Gastranaerophilales bacterium]